MSGQLGFFIHLSLILLVAFLLLKPLFKGRKRLPEYYLQQMKLSRRKFIVDQPVTADARFYIGLATPMTRQEFEVFLSTYELYFQEMPHAN
jgi:hypothetical protein